MKVYLLAYAGTLLSFLLIDAVWLGFIARQFYADQLGSLMREDIQWVPAAVFYLVYAAGIVILAIRPAQAGLPLSHIAFYGALVGFIAYGTYDFTNLATLKNWPVWMSAVDLVWGTVLSATVATLGALTARAFS